MKKLSLYLAILASILIIMGSCVTTKTPMPTDNIDELIGTWVNPENKESETYHPFGKIELLPDKSMQLYSNSDDTLSVLSLLLEVKEKWMDRKGLIYIDAIMHLPFADRYCLLRVNQKENTLEMMLSSEDIGNKLKFDTTAGFLDSPSYYIWYRQ